jgi:hypothetical protein
MILCATALWQDFSMTSDELRDGFHALDELSSGDYHKSLNELFDSNLSDQEKSLKIGRLVGVAMKEPFARAVVSETPSEITGAFRQWQLNEDSFGIPGIEETWQYRTLEAMRADPAVAKSLGAEKFETAAALAKAAHAESGFFACLAASAKKYLCGDPKSRSEIENIIKKAKAQGLNVSNATPEFIVLSAGSAIAAYLIPNFAFFGFLGAPAIAGLVLIIYKIGLNAFCQWGHPLAAEDKL